MTPKARTFDLYLLSRMRASAAVQDALKELGANNTEMTQAAARVTAAGFAYIVLFVQQYIDILGPAYRQEAEDDECRDYRFGAARRLRFRRPPWRDFDFTVGSDENDCVFGLGFFRRGGVPIPKLESLADLSPWRFVRSEVVARFGTPRREDEWSGWEDLSLEIPDGSDRGRRRYLLRFDYDLLQDYHLLDE